jgi:hypothetical protein
MKKIIMFLLAFAMIFAVSCTQEGQDGKTDFKLPELIGEPGEWDFYNSRAEHFVILMANGDFDKAYDMFDEALKQAMTAAVLKNDVWDIISAQAGAFGEIYKTENLTADGYYICFVTSKHKNIGVTLRVVFSENGSISGLFIDGYPEIEEGG